MQEGQGTGRTPWGSSGSGRESRESRESNGGRERTGRNIISNDSARVGDGGSGGGSRGVEGTGGSVVVNGLFSSKSRDSTGGGGESYNRRKTAPEPPPYHDDDTAVTQEPQLPVPSSSLSVPVRSTAPASTVPERNGGAHRAAATAVPRAVVEDPAYLFTDTYPYTYKQFDREDEGRLLVRKLAFRAIVGVHIMYGSMYLSTIRVGVESNKIPDGLKRREFQVLRISGCRVGGPRVVVQGIRLPRLFYLKIVFRSRFCF